MEERISRVLLALNEEILNLKEELKASKENGENWYRWWQKEEELRKATQAQLAQANARIADLEQMLNPTVKKEEEQA